MLTDYRITDAA